MTAIVAAGRRHLPRGWLDLGRQLAIWFGFLALYQVARGVADRNPTRAFENGLGVINIEERVGDLFEVTLANLIAGSHFLTFVVSWTYWNSEFTVVGLTLLFVYLRRYTYFHRFRNWILLANTIGLVGYVALPTAPPRMFPTFGFPDTLAEFGGLNHGSGLIQLASNPYAAMPSLHAADALIVGVSMFARLPAVVVEDDLAALAGVGLVRGHGDRQPLLARHPRRDRRRRDRGRRDLPASRCGGASARPRRPAPA